MMNITEKSRHFMEVNNLTSDPSDFKEHIGKLDHGTCILIKIRDFEKSMISWTKALSPKQSLNPVTAIPMEHTPLKNESQKVLTSRAANRTKSPESTPTGSRKPYVSSED